MYELFHFMITPDGRGSCRQDGRPRRHCAHAARRRVTGVTNGAVRIFLNPYFLYPYFACPKVIHKIKFKHESLGGQKTQ